MKIQVIAVEYLRYLQYDRNFKDLHKRRRRVGEIVMFWLHREIESVTFNDVTSFIKSMLDRKCQPSYINTFLGIIRSILKFASKRELKVINYKDIEFLSVPKKVIRFLNKEEMQELLNFFDGVSLYDYRNRAITAMLMDAGLRISECLSLNKADFNKIMNGNCIVTGKFSKQRVASFTWSREYVKDYMDQRGDSHEALFITHCLDTRWRIKRLMQDGYRKYLREADEALGFQVSPKVLRATALTNWKNNGMELKAVSLLAGHDSVSTTEKYYLGVDWNRLLKLHQQFSFI